MTSREQRTRDLLDAAASSRRVDGWDLWRRVESRIEDGSRRSSKHPALLAAAAVAAAAVAGAAIWAGGLGPSATPAASSQTSTVRSSPSPTGATTPTASDTTSAATTTSRLSTADLLVASDYRAAGWVVDVIQATEGWGQSPISTCQDIPGEGGPGTPVHRGDGYATVAGRSLATYQYVLDVGTPARAEALVNRVLQWPDTCASLGRGGVDEGVIKGTPPQLATLPDGARGYWYTLTFEQGGATRAELVAVTRRAERVSVVVLYEPKAPGALGAVDENALVTRSFERLG